jgi:3-deoxy-D-manno-octulosonic acid kinase
MLSARIFSFSFKPHMQQEPTTIWQDERIGHRFVEQDFDLDHWTRQADTQLLGGGRGGSVRFDLEGKSYVLRRYLRGGKMAALLKDRYLWGGRDSSRPAREQRAIERAMQHGLPVPPVAAWLTQRSGLYYRAAIISRFIPNLGTVASFLGERALADDRWSALGALIRRLHEAGIFHADLNANNILIDTHDEFHLIDFDKAVLDGDANLGQDNLARLLRSLNKIGRGREADGKPWHFREEDWTQLQAGYDADGR